MLVLQFLFLINDVCVWMFFIGFLNDCEAEIDVGGCGERQ